MLKQVFLSYFDSAQTQVIVKSFKNEIWFFRLVESEISRNETLKRKLNVILIILMQEFKVLIQEWENPLNRRGHILSLAFQTAL